MPNEVFTDATLHPTEILAGDSDEFVIALTVGEGYTPGASRIILDFPGMVGMSRPSLSHQESDGFMEAYVSNPHVTYTKRLWDMEKNGFVTPARNTAPRRPWGPHCALRPGSLSVSRRSRPPG